MQNLDPSLSEDPTPAGACRPYRILLAPSVLGLKPTGVERLGEQLLQENLASRLQAQVVARLRPLIYSAVRDRETGTLNAHAIAEWTPRLADAVAAVVDDNGFPLVLGGDCSMLLGLLLALRRKCRSGLLFIDGHADFYQPEVNSNGAAASMDLAFAPGYGPSLLTDIEGRRPLVRSADVALIGYRDAAEQLEYHSEPLPQDLLAIDLAALRRQGVADAAR